MLPFQSGIDPAQQLHQLQRFRWGLVFTSYLAAALAWLFNYPISSWSLLLLLLVLYAASNQMLAVLAANTAWPYRLVSLTILLDLLLFSLMLALSGGASNGLIALLLLPVAISAVILPARLALLSAALAVACYLLLALQLPGESNTTHNHHHPQFNSHLWQMAWAFALSAFFIAAFVSSQARLIRLQSRQLSQLQQQQLQQEQMLAVATYAANAAHDLATPLQNLTLLSDELCDVFNQTHQQSAHSDAITPSAITANTMAPQQALLDDLCHEINRCQQIVRQLRQNAQRLREPAQPQELSQVISQAIELWLVSRPEISLQLHKELDDSIALITDPLAWSAAIFNMLDNAASAGLQNQQNRLELLMQQSNGAFLLQIRDFGQGLDERRLAELGRLPQQDTEGMGLGQFLANTAIERLGGRVERQNLPTGGLLTRIEFTASAKPHQSGVT